VGGGGGGGWVGGGGRGASNTPRMPPTPRPFRASNELHETRSTYAERELTLPARSLSFRVQVWSHCSPFNASRRTDQSRGDIDFLGPQRAGGSWKGDPSMAALSCGGSPAVG